MPIASKNMLRGVRKRLFNHTIDISAADTQGAAYLDYDGAVRILSIDFIYATATDAGTVPENIQVGTAATPTLYFAGAPTQSQAAGTIESKTLASTAQLPASTALIINKSAATGGTNTGVVTVSVWLEPV